MGGVAGGEVEVPQAVDESLWKGKDGEVNEFSFPQVGRTTVNHDDVSDYSKAVAEALCKGHDKIKEDIIQFLCPPLDHGGDCDAESDLPAYDIKSANSDDVIRYQVFLTKSRRGAMSTISHRAEEIIKPEEQMAKSEADSHDQDYAELQVRQHGNPVALMGKNLQAANPSGIGASPCASAAPSVVGKLALGSVVGDPSPVASADTGFSISSVRRKEGKPLAKTLAKKGLPAWEEVDDHQQSMEKLRAQAEAGQTSNNWTPFVDDEEMDDQTDRQFEEWREDTYENKMYTYTEFAKKERASTMWKLTEENIRSSWDDRGKMKRVEEEQDVKFWDNEKGAYVSMNGDKKHHHHLPSYEEQVLGVSKAKGQSSGGKKPLDEGDREIPILELLETPATRQAQAQIYGEASSHGGTHEVDLDPATGRGMTPVEEKSAFERMMEDANFEELPTDQPKLWHWMGGDLAFPHNEPVLSWSGKENNENIGAALALCTDPDLKLSNLDAEVDLKIRAGHAGGLVVRAYRDATEHNVTNYWMVRFDAFRKEVGVVEVNDVRSKLSFASRNAADDQRQGNSKSDHETYPDGGFYYFKFAPVKMRGSEKKGETLVQLSRLLLREKHGGPVSLSSALAVCPFGSSLKGCGPEKACDDAADYSAWVADVGAVGLGGRKAAGADAPRVLDPNRASMVIQFEERINADAFCFSTPKDSPSRDPVQWVLSGSNDGLQWHPLHCMGVDYLTPLNATTEWFHFNPAVRKVGLNVTGPYTDWYRFRVRALGPSLVVYFEEEQIAAVLDANMPRPSNIGVWCAYSEDNLGANDMPLPRALQSNDATPDIHFRDFGVIQLEDLWTEINSREGQLHVEQARMERQHRQTLQENQRTIKATKLICEVSKIKIKYMKQKMFRYDQASAEGREAKLRDREILTWLCLLSVLSKFHDQLNHPDMVKAKNTKFLRQLQQDVPPPPPPPAQEPPSKEDEELHYAYEAMKQRYEPQWTQVGRMVLGKEKFEDIRKKENGPAEKEKGLIAQKCLKRAMEVMSEREHQEFVQKAWCLENDWKPKTEVDEAEMKRWYRQRANQVRAGEPGGSGGGTASL